MRGKDYVTLFCDALFGGFSSRASIRRHRFVQGTFEIALRRSGGTGLRPWTCKWGKGEVSFESYSVNNGLTAATLNLKCHFAWWNTKWRWHFLWIQSHLWILNLRVHSKTIAHVMIWHTSIDDYGLLNTVLLQIVSSIKGTECSNA